MTERTKKRPAWLTGEASEGPDERPTGEITPKRSAAQGAAPAAAPGTGPDQWTKEVLSRSTQTTLPQVAAPRGAPGSAPAGVHNGAQNGAGSSSQPAPKTSGIFEALTSPGTDGKRRLVFYGLAALGMILILFAIKAVVFPPLSTEHVSGENAAGSSPTPAAHSSPGTRDTGAVFGALQTNDEEASLDGPDNLHWDGAIEKGEAGQTITLKGPTAAQIRTGFEMPRSSIRSGLFAVAQDGGTVLHVTFHTFDSEETETTQGSIFAVDNDELTYSGFYRDERQKGTDTVVRTYLPPGGGNYRVSFKVPQGTPILLLVGFKGTGDRAAKGAA